MRMYIDHIQICICEQFRYADYVISLILVNQILIISILCTELCCQTKNYGLRHDNSRDIFIMDIVF